MLSPEPEEGVFFPTFQQRWITSYLLLALLPFMNPGPSSFVMYSPDLTSQSEAMKLFVLILRTGNSSLFILTEKPPSHSFSKINH